MIMRQLTVSAKVARKDANGKRVKEVVDGKKVTVYDTVEKTIKKDNPARLHARRLISAYLYDVTEVPTQNAGKKKNTKERFDLYSKSFMDEGLLLSMQIVPVLYKNDQNRSS